MKWALSFLLIGVITAALLLVRFLPKPTSTDNSGSAPTVRLKTATVPNQEPDAVYRIKNRITLPNSLPTQLQPGSEAVVAGTVVLENDKGDIIEHTESPVKVWKDEAGDLIIETETSILLFVPSKRQNRWKMVMVVPNGDSGVAYQWGKFWLMDCDILMTSARLAVGVFRKFRYGYLGIAGSWNFKENNMEPVGYAGLRIQF